MNTFSGRQAVLKLGQLLNQSAQKETHREPRRRAKLAKLGRNPKNKTRENTGVFRGSADLFASVRTEGVGPTGLEPVTFRM